MKFRRPRSGPLRGVAVVALALLVTMAIMFHTSIYSGVSIKTTTILHSETDQPTLVRLWKIARNTDTAEEFILEVEKQAKEGEGGGENKSETTSSVKRIESGENQEKTGSDGDSKSRVSGTRNKEEEDHSSEDAKESQSTGTPEELPSSPSSEPSNSDAAVPAVIPRLSKKLAHQHARNNVIIVTWANLHFSDFALNWVAHVREHGITNFLVGAMDQETAEVSLNLLLKVLDFTVNN